MEDRVTALSVIDSIDNNLVARTMAKIAQFQEVIRNTLVEGRDFGKIPGCGDKPSLFKAGAEKINMLMGCSTSYVIMDKTEDYDKGFFAYNVKCIISRNGVLITEGVGNCNSREKKYVNQDPYSLTNTILKMAKKRAYVDATLSLASLSDIFTQDIEDLSENEATTADNPGDVVITFGKHKGRTLADLYENERDYFDWLAEKNDKMKQYCKAFLDSLQEQNLPGTQPTKQGETPRPKMNGNGEAVKWDNFWASVKNLGYDENEVHNIASEVYGTLVMSMKEVIKTQADANKFLNILAKRRNENEQTA